LTTVDHCFGPNVGPAETTAAALQQRLDPTLDPAQQRLSAGERVLADRGLLVILQAVNAGGKDGTIAELVEMLDRPEVRVERFRRREPGTSVDDLFDRALAAGPALGELVFFHRSYYEELLRAVLENDADATDIRRAVTDLEHAFAARSTVVVKLFLHIDRDEQLRRLDRRRDRPHLVGLHNPADYRDQDRWDELMAAYQTVLACTHTSQHPWLIIPANDPAVRNGLVAEVLRAHFER
jgi:polyphosphate kinase 2 (PPK2 family)